MSRSTRKRAVSGIALVVGTAFVWPGPSIGRAQPAAYTLACGSGRTIGQALKTLKPGDTLVVSGTCNENVDIGDEFQRITLDGQNTAVINGDASAHAVTVRGRGITIRGFTVTGGSPQGINVQDGGSAVIDGNVVRNNARNGIGVFRSSSADIIHNTIDHNGVAGIVVDSTSSARIGWAGPPNNRVSLPNTIQDNGSHGIQVIRGSSAQIYTNTIQGNGGHGIFVDRNAQAQVAGCTITGNALDGIRATRGSAVDIGSDVGGVTPQFDDDTNTGTNGGFGVTCTIAGFVDGHLATLTGTSGSKSFAKGCTDNVAVP
jgi:parallel beta-helix repeat protein